LVEREGKLLGTDGRQDCLRRFLAAEFGFPRGHLFGVVKVAAGDHGQAALEHFVEYVRAARHFPGVEIGPKFFASVPEMEGLFFHFPRGNGVGRDREAAHFADLGANVFNV